MRKERRIRLACGRYARVDACDYERLRAHKWHLKANAYAATYVGAGRYVYMHKMVCGFSLTDHRNGDGLDNRRANLRRSTHAQNTYNRGPTRRSASGLKGVSWHCQRHHWEAGIVVRGRRIWLGRFPSARLAARAYDRAARRHFGTFAWVNFGRKHNG